MTFLRLHAWPRSAAAAIALQKRLRGRVCVRPCNVEPRLVAGVDCAFSPDGSQVIAGVVVWDRADRRIVEQAVRRRPCRFPYVPGLLSFRELPAVLAAFRKLRCEPDAVLCDAQGLAHPRRFGLASHLGVWLDRTTIGCAKSRLCGGHDEPANRRGAFVPLTDRGEQVGVVLRSRDGVKPLYISVGHRCDADSAVRIVLSCGGGYRLPEPTRAAHRLVTAERTRCAR